MSARVRTRRFPPRLSGIALVPASALAVGLCLAADARAQEARELPPPERARAAGFEQPNLGMHRLAQFARRHEGLVRSDPIELPAGTIPPRTPRPLGWILASGDLYQPDLDPDRERQRALLAATGIFDDAQLPEPLWLGNTDPSGSIDGTALDADGKPIHFNLHWPPGDAPAWTWLDEQGLEPNSPTDDLERLLAEIAETRSRARVGEALDVLLGTNESGALLRKAYRGFPLLRTRRARANTSFDPETRNAEVTVLWYGTEIAPDCQLLEVPMHGDYTITWRLVGLGDVGPERERAFPIDEFSALVMKKASNGAFWMRNSWIWKWFGAVEHEDGRRYALESLYALHTGTDAAPSYSELRAGDPRYWLRADRELDLGSFVGQDALDDPSRWHALDLDLDGKIGGFLVDGTDTGAAHDAEHNPEAQFNRYGNSEYAVPRIDWSVGPMHVPHFAYDSSFTTVRKGTETRVAVRYSDGELQSGLYLWGWRVHPPRIAWIETYSPGQFLPSGAPKDWRFGHRWEEIERLGPDAVGEHAPEKRIWRALVALRDGAGSAADFDAFAAAVSGCMRFVRDRRGLPPTEGVLDFPDAEADINFLYSNFDIWSDRENAHVRGSRSWREGDVVTIAIHNDDAVTRSFRVVDFGTTDYQYNGLDMGLLDWKPVFGFPQLAARAWSPPTSAWRRGFGEQGLELHEWRESGIASIGNPFLVPLGHEEPERFWPADQRDLLHDFASLTGFSGPGFTSELADPDGVWRSPHLAGRATGHPDLWAYSYGVPIAPHTTVRFRVELPRAAGLNNGALYLFDPQFHSGAIFTMHPLSEAEVEGLRD